MISDKYYLWIRLESEIALLMAKRYHKSTKEKGAVKNGNNFSKKAIFF